MFWNEILGRIIGTALVLNIKKTQIVVLVETTFRNGVLLKKILSFHYTTHLRNTFST